MMKKHTRVLALGLTCTALLSLATPAMAARQNSSTTPISASGTTSVTIPSDGTLAFSQIGERVKANNLTLKAAEESLKQAKAMDWDDAIDEMEDAIDNLDIQISQLINGSSYQLEAANKALTESLGKVSVSEGTIREPLNNSLYPVSTQCISRHLRLVKVISAQNSHYLSTFLLHFPKKGRLPLCQIVESFLPAMASAYKLAQANMAYSRFSFFFRPRYTVFL